MNPITNANKKRPLPPYLWNQAMAKRVVTRFVLADSKLSDSECSQLMPKYVEACMLTDWLTCRYEALDVNGKLIGRAVETAKEATWTPSMLLDSILSLAANRVRPWEVDKQGTYHHKFRVKGNTNV